MPGGVIWVQFQVPPKHLSHHLHVWPSNSVTSVSSFLGGGLLSFWLVVGVGGVVGILAEMRALYLLCIREVNLELRDWRVAVNARIYGSYHLVHQPRLLMQLYSVSSFSKSSSIVKCRKCWKLGCSFALMRHQMGARTTLVKSKMLLLKRDSVFGKLRVCFY